MVAILNVIVELVISLCVIATPFGVIAGIILAIVMATEKDTRKKKALMWWMISSFVGPIAVLLFVLALWGLVHLVSATFGS